MECPACHECPACPSPDFIERNGAWLITVVGMFTACVGGMFTYFLKSRCSHIKCLGFECDRNVIELGPGEVRVETNSKPPK